MRLLMAACVALAAGYVARGAQLQLIEGERWEAVARAQHAARLEIPGERGTISDRHGRPLALEAPRFRVYLAPSEAEDRDRALETISRSIGLSPAEERRMRADDEGWVTVPRLASPAERDRLRAGVRSGLYFDRLAGRVYPQGRLTRPLLGAVSVEGEGRSGLELALDSLLRGASGSALGRRDAHGGLHPVPEGEIEPPRPGHDVSLTLDAELQKLAEEALDEALRETGATGGDLLVADPNTGEILALASRRAAGSLRVPALTDPYEPGSTLKPFLLAALLAEGRARLSERVFVENGVYRHNGRVIRDVHPEDSLTVAEIVRYSSNIGAAKLASRLRPGLQYRYLRDFGFGIETGVRYPAESAGRLRRPERWSGFSQASLAMGYEISVTSLQLVAAYGALANGGVLMRPYLVREVRDPEGRIVHRGEPHPIRRVVEPDVARRVTRVLSSVVEGGTGSRAALSTLTVAGKTGTARVAGEAGYETGRYSASFVGYTPAEAPNLVILTKLEDPQGEYYGGLTAAPISRSTLQAALATRGLSLPRSRALGAVRIPRLRWGSGGDDETGPDDGPFVFAVSGPPPSGAGDAERDGALRVLPDLRGLPLRTAVARLHEIGLRVELAATGRVRVQEPGPGTRLRAGATVRLR